MKIEIATVNACKDLLLQKISDSGSNELFLIIAGASPNGPIQDLVFSENSVIKNVQAINHADVDPIFEIYWSSYIAYSVRNESYAQDDDIVESSGLICTYSKSAFLDYIEKTTFASEDYPGPFRHWGITCMDHIIDIVSTEEPSIKLLSQP